MVKQEIKHFRKAGTGKIMSVCLMIFCLVFLTSINFIIYAGDADTVITSTTAPSSDEDDNGFPPSGPTEEKSSTSSLSITEEILHEAHPEFNFQAVDQLYLHHIAEAENIEMFHPELILPPPKL